MLPAALVLVVLGLAGHSLAEEVVVQTPEQFASGVQAAFGPARANVSTTLLVNSTSLSLASTAFTPMSPVDSGSLTINGGSAALDTAMKTGLITTLSGAARLALNNLTLSNL